MINDANKLNKLFNKIKISFPEACKIGDLETIKLYKETGVALTVSFSLGFRNACYSANMELIKYLLKEIPDNLLKEMQEENNNHLEATTNKELIKFLLESDEVKYKSDIHHNNDKYFHFLCKSSIKSYSKAWAIEMLSGFIFEDQIKETTTMQEIMVDFPEIKKMFMIRDLNHKLNNELYIAKTKNKLKI